MRKPNEENFQYWEPVTKARVKMAKAKAELEEALRKLRDRPYAVYVMYNNPQWNQDWWQKESKSSFKHEKEAIRAAGRKRLNLPDNNHVVVIRKWNAETQVWENYN